MVVPLLPPQSFRERVGAFRHLPTFFRLVWNSSPKLTLASFGLRLVRAVVPVLALYVGKLIIDTVVAEARLPHPGWSLSDWIESGRLNRVGGLVRSQCTMFSHKRATLQSGCHPERLAPRRKIKTLSFLYPNADAADQVDD
jgi:hypothetical protein